MTNEDRQQAVARLKEMIADIEADKVRGVFACLEYRQEGPDGKFGDGIKYTRHASWAMNCAANAYIQVNIEAKAREN